MAPPVKRPTRSGTSVKETRLSDIGNRYLLDDYDKKLLRLRVRYTEISLKDLGAEVKLSVSAVSERMDKPAFKIALEEYNIPLDKLFEKSVNKAYNTLLALMNDTDPQVRLKAASIVLQRFCGPTTVVNQSVENKTNVVKVYRTTIEPDGSLLGRVMDLELGPNGEIPQEPKYNLPVEGDTNE